MILGSSGEIGRKNEKQSNKRNRKIFHINDYLAEFPLRYTFSLVRVKGQFSRLLSDSKKQI